MGALSVLLKIIVYCMVEFSIKQVNGFIKDIHIPMSVRVEVRSISSGKSETYTLDVMAIDMIGACFKYSP